MTLSKKKNQLQIQMKEQIVKHQEQEKLNAELHLELLEEKEKLTVREQENSMLERRVKELSGEVERTRMLHLVRVNTIPPDTEIHEQITMTNGYGKVCKTSSTLPTSVSALWTTT